MAAPPLSGPADAQAPLTWDDDQRAGLLDVMLPLWNVRWRLLGVLLLAALAGFALSLLQPLMFSGRSSFVVQGGQRPSQALAAAALPALAGLVGPGAGTADLHVSLLQSLTITDRIIERFNLQRVWEQDYRIEARRQLARRVTFTVGRRDNLVRIDVLDESPHRAAEMANQYVEELRLMLRGFAVEEARERRLFYDTQMQRARDALALSQRALQASGYDRAALRTEPRAATEAYARLELEVGAAEVRLAAARRTRSETSTEVQQHLVEIATRRAQLARMEKPRDEDGGRFVTKLRDFRSAEALVESLSRQAEAARVDEAANTSQLQLVDRALTPEWPTSPRRMVWMLAAAALAIAVYGGGVLLRHRLALAKFDAAHRHRVARLRAALPQP